MGGIQIAGNKCKVCGQIIVFANEGKYCAHCGTVVHLACEPQTKCNCCGQLFQQYEPPDFDPLSAALIPPVLRSKSGGPMFAIVAAVFMLIVVVLIFYGMLNGLKGH
jgi:hypothetical protein